MTSNMILLIILISWIHYAFLYCNQIRYKLKSNVYLISGERFIVESNCYERSTGEHMTDTNSQAMFVTTPYRFNFDRTLRNFKPGLPIVYQVSNTLYVYV